jgi:hypothetical protein
MNILFAMTLAATFAPGCAVHVGARAHRPAPIVVATPRPVAVVHTAPAPMPPATHPAAPPAERGWERLGHREVDFRADRDAIPVGGREGSFRAIRIDVRGAPLEMYDMVIHFENGERFSPTVRHVFGQGTESRRIDLPGAERRIARIDFTYRSIAPARGKASVDVFGLN